MRPVPDVEALAQELHSARLDRTPVPMLSERPAGLDLATAYAVQACGLALREAAGESVVGGKLGFTSEAMRRAMGVTSPNHGWLTDVMLDDGDLDVTTLIHPKVEPEIAFLLGADVTGPGVTPADVLAATAAVAPCLEVVDSRFVDFRFRAADNIADNSSAGRLVLGDPLPLERLDGHDLRLVGCVLGVDGEVTHRATGAAAHGDPAAAVAWMANHCGTTLRAGWVVISGGLTPPVDLVPGRTVTVELDRIGSARVRVVRPISEPLEDR